MSVTFCIAHGAQCLTIGSYSHASYAQFQANTLIFENWDALLVQKVSPAGRKMLHEAVVDDTRATYETGKEEL